MNRELDSGIEMRLNSLNFQLDLIDKTLNKMWELSSCHAIIGTLEISEIAREEKFEGFELNKDIVKDMLIKLRERFLEEKELVEKDLTEVLSKELLEIKEKYKEEEK